MKVVTIAINKGGTGKTTISKSIATAAAGFNVLVLDVDSQENARKWGNRRKDRNPYKILPLVKFSTENSLPDELEQAKRAGCDLVFIDTPPGRSTEAVAAVKAADLMLIPFEADDQDSFDGIPKPPGWRGRTIRRLSVSSTRRRRIAVDRSKRRGWSAKWPKYL